jgi:hypothetical protein
MQRVFMIVGAAALVACSKSSTEPAPGYVAGSWSGSISDVLVGNGTFTMSLAQTGDSVTGTWTTTYADTANNLGGLAIGHMIGPMLTILLKPINPPTCQYGPFEVTASLTAGTSLSGTYTTVQCTAADSGTVSVTKQ